MTDKDALLNETRDRLAKAERQVSELRDVEQLILDATELRKQASCLSTQISNQIDLVSTFCQWFKNNPGCISCPMWQQDSELQWRCTL